MNQRPQLQGGKGTWMRRTQTMFSLSAQRALEVFLCAAIVRKQVATACGAYKCEMQMAMVHTYLPIYIHTYVCAYIYAYIYIYIHRNATEATTSA